MEVHNVLAVGEIGSNPANPTICKICGKEFNTTKNLKIHLSSHNFGGYRNWYNYLYKYENFMIPKCPYCKKDCKLGSRRGFQKTCGNKECIKKYNSENQKNVYKIHPELRDLHRKQRCEFLSIQSNRDKTAWANRSNGNYSYLERYFIDNYILPFSLQKKFNIINEYSVYPYFLDFAFLDIKLDIEIDGRCHFNNGINRIEHDIKRDKDLSDKGWKVYRISYDEINLKSSISKFIDFIENYKNYKYDENRQIIKYLEYNKTRNQKKKDEKLDKKSKRNIKIHDILLKIAKDDDIHLSKFGWNKIVIKILNDNDIIAKSNIRRFINRHCPEFFELKEVYNKCQTNIHIQQMAC